MQLRLLIITFKTLSLSFVCIWMKLEILKQHQLVSSYMHQLFSFENGFFHTVFLSSDDNGHITTLFFVHKTVIIHPSLCMFPFKYATFVAHVSSPSHNMCIIRSKFDAQKYVLPHTNTRRQVL